MNNLLISLYLKLTENEGNFLIATKAVCEVSLDMGGFSSLVNCWPR
jgi:hypothetical protein